MRYFILPALTSLLLAGCDTSGTDSVASRSSLISSGRAVSATMLADLGTHETIDDMVSNAGLTIPGLGGVYYDGDHYVIGVTGAVSSALYGSIPNQLSRLLPDLDLTQGDVEFKVVDYRFRDLHAWRVALRPTMSQEGALAIGVSDSRNRVVIHAQAGAVESVRQRIASFAATAGIPMEAILVEEGEAFSRHFDLRDGYPSIPGGVQIDPTNAPLGECTLGFNAVTTSGGKRVFVTNSHCSGTQGGVQGTIPYQASYSGDRAIGIEIADPIYSNSNAIGCPSGKVCRFSDSALFEYYPNVNVRFGRVVRTEERTQYGGSILRIGEFILSDAAGVVYEGQTVDKVGRTTGWTYGQVYENCMDTPVAGTNVFLICQNFATMGNQGGDSGSLIFTYASGYSPSNPGYIVARGLLWGGNGAGNLTVFSNLYDVQYELGSLDVHNNEPDSPSYPGDDPGTGNCGDMVLC